MTIDRKMADEICRADLGAFVYGAHAALYPGQPLTPNWHIDALCFRIQQMVRGTRAGRLVVNLPPRALKSFIISVAFPAWVLGRNPSWHLICASYADDLAAKFSRDCRSLLETPFFRRVFPQAKLNPKKAAESEFETTRRGSRLATSVGGVLTGRGGNVLIVDDPLKANDAGSEPARRGAVEWFRNTVLSRLDEPRSSIIIVTMQRLHVDDLAGMLIEQGWPSFVVPAIAEEPASYAVAEDEFYNRAIGELLQPDRDSVELLEQLKRDLGSHNFAAQYSKLRPRPTATWSIGNGWPDTTRR